LVPRILVFIGGLLLASCASQLPDRRPSLDDPSNPLALESAARLLPPTLAAPPAPEMEGSPAQAPQMHHHQHGGMKAPEREGAQAPKAEGAKAPAPRGGDK
jgi:hypothetical protein